MIRTTILIGSLLAFLMSWGCKAGGKAGASSSDSAGTGPLTEAGPMALVPKHQAALIPGNVRVIGSLKSWEWFCKTFKLAQVAKLMKAKKEDSKGPVNVWDLDEVARAGVNIGAPVSFFVAASKGELLPVLFDLKDPRTFLALLRKHKDLTVKKVLGTEVFHSATSRTFVKGRLGVIVSGSKEEKHLDALVMAMLSLKRADSLAEGKQYNTTMKHLGFGRYFTLYIDTRAFLGDVPGRLGPIPRPLLTLLAASLSQVRESAVGLSLDKGRALLKATLGLRQKTGLWRFLRTTGPGVGWKSVSKKPLLALSVGLDTKSIVNEFKNITEQEPALKGAGDSFAARNPLVGKSPLEIIEMIGDQGELYVTGPSRLRSTLDLRVSLFLQLKDPTGVTQLVEKLAHLGGDRVSTVTIGGKPFQSMAFNASGNQLLMGVVDSTLVMSNDKTIVERMVSHKRESWLDAITDKAVKAMALGRHVAYLEMDYTIFSSFMALDAAMGKSPKDRQVQKALSRMGTIYNGLRATSGGLEWNAIWGEKNFSEWILNFYKIGDTKE